MSTMYSYDEQERKAVIKVIGVGGGGGDSPFQRLLSIEFQIKSFD